MAKTIFDYDTQDESPSGEEKKVGAKRTHKETEDSSHIDKYMLN